jgi:tetratricopeptide (TPR) repeat protein
MTRSSSRFQRKTRAVSNLALFLPLVISILSFDFIALAQTAKRRSSAAPQSSFDRLAKRAMEARDANRTDDAIALYRQGLKTKPSWAEGWWYLGTLLYDLERHGEARDALRKLAALKPDGGPTWALIGLCEFRLREYQQALIHLMRARALGVGGNEEIAFVANYHTALLLTRFEQFEGGSEILSSLARQHPANPAIVEAFGINLLRLPFLPPELPPERREIVLRMGRAADHFVSNRAEDARVEFEDLIKDYPKTPNIHYSYGMFLLRATPDAALEKFQRELELSPKHVPSMLQIAFEYLKRSEHATGLPYAERAAQLDPNSFPARNALGRILLELGQTERAIIELETGVKLAPESPEMHFALARAYSRASRKSEAAKERAEFMRLDKIRRGQREGLQSPIPADPRQPPSNQQ